MSDNVANVDGQDTAEGRLKRSASKSSFRTSFRTSKQKLDDFFKSPHFDLRKRKRYRVAEDEDCSSSRTDVNLEEPCKKKSALSRLSTSNLMSPMRTVKKVGDVLQKSFSIHNLKSPQTTGKYHPATPYRQPSATLNLRSPRRRLSTYWHETIDNSEVVRFNKHQIERQEAIFELYKSEADLIEDLQMVKTTYRDSMKKLGLLSDVELVQIFGQIDALVPLHQELVNALQDQRLPDGTTENVGQVLVNWVPQLKTYASYCSNQVYAKALLDAKKHDPAVEDFLQRCQDSPFSRKLDLWSFLDVPRSRLVKYPLLFKSIQKYTCPEHEDNVLIDQALDIVETAIKDVDLRAGQSKCQFTIEKLEFLDDKQRHPLISESQFIMCDGLLKSSRGLKLHVFLFDKILVLTRRSTRGDDLRYQVYRQPIPLSEICVKDLGEGQEVQKGSFKNAFSQNQSVKHSFKVSNKRIINHNSYILQANDEQDKHHWLQCLQTAIQNRPVADDSISTRSSVSRGGSFSFRDEPFILEDANSSIGSLSSLVSVFSTDSTQSGMITRLRVRAVPKKSEGDEDSGIVS